MILKWTISLYGKAPGRHLEFGGQFGAFPICDLSENQSGLFGAAIAI